VTRNRRLHAARYLRVLADIERAIVNRESWTEARRLLDSIDPLEAESLAALLERDIEPEQIPIVGSSRKSPAPARRSRTPW